MRNICLFISLISFFSIITSCGNRGEKSNAPKTNVDSTVIVSQTIIQPHPDTVFESVKMLKTVKIDTFLTEISGTLENFDNQYKNIENILTFRGDPSRETPFAGKIKGTPSIVKVDWEFDTGNGITPRWGGGSGWTGQPLYVNWTDEQASRIKKEAADAASFLMENQK